MSTEIDWFDSLMSLLHYFELLIRWSHLKIDQLMVFSAGIVMINLPFGFELDDAAAAAAANSSGGCS